MGVTIILLSCCITLLMMPLVLLSPLFKISRIVAAWPQKLQCQSHCTNHDNAIAISLHHCATASWLLPLDYKFLLMPSLSHCVATVAGTWCCCLSVIMTSLLLWLVNCLCQWNIGTIAMLMLLPHAATSWLLPSGFTSPSCHWLILPLNLIVDISWCYCLLSTWKQLPWHHGLLCLAACDATAVLMQLHVSIIHCHWLIVVFNLAMLFSIYWCSYQSLPCLSMATAGCNAATMASLDAVAWQLVSQQQLLPLFSCWPLLVAW